MGEFSINYKSDSDYVDDVVFMKVKCMKESCEIFDGFKIFVGSVYIIFFKVNWNCNGIFFLRNVWF